MFFKAVFVSLFFLVAACTKSTESNSTAEAEAGPVALSVWVHSGQESERAVIQAQVERFNASQAATKVALNVIPEGSYNAQVQAAAVANELPDLYEVDGPFLYKYVWQGKVRPLDNLIASQTKAKVLPSLIDQGTFGGKLYGVGVFDSGLGLYASKSKLETHGIRIPNGAEDSWSLAEFEAALATLAADDPDQAVLDLKLNYQGEWFTYAFYAALNSGKGGLIDRSDYQRSTSILDSAESIKVLTHLQNWITAGWVDANVDDAAFASGRVALSWVGHWAYPQYKASLGDDLIVLPLPDFGNGSLTGQGSWQWVVNANTSKATAAAAFLEFLLSADEVLEMANANGAVPGNLNAIAASTHYQPGGDLALYAEQLASGFSIPRPKTPAYPVITSTFQELFAELRAGADVTQLVQEAATKIDQDIAENEGYKLLN